MTKRGKCCFSSTHTEKPCLSSRAAATAPEGPAPMMAISQDWDMFGLLKDGGGVSGSFSDGLEGYLKMVG